jgi:bifunctional DNase/RNase
MFIGMEVVGVRVEMPSNQPIVLLKELDGARYLPIWLGAVEATAIAFAQQEVIPPRPLTHDLFKDVLGQLGAKLNTVYLTEIKDGIFYAQLNFQDGPAVSARPSDAIALALRIGAPILASEQLLEDAGIEIPDQAEDEVERFKEFLDQINPEDFLG